jgi:hypothetical protein
VSVSKGDLWYCEKAYRGVRVRRMGIDKVPSKERDAINTTMEGGQGGETGS